MAEFLDSNVKIHGPLQRGAVGLDVWRMQMRIERSGGAHLNCDGRFGRRTQEALRGYQSRNGLTADGVFGPKTAARMGFKNYQSKSMSQAMGKALGGMNTAATRGLNLSPGMAAIYAAAATLAAGAGKSAKPGPFSASAVLIANALSSTIMATVVALNGMPFGPQMRTSGLERALAQAQMALFRAAGAPPEARQVVATAVINSVKSLQDEVQKMLSEAERNTPAGQAREAGRFIVTQLASVGSAIIDWIDEATSGAAPKTKIQGPVGEYVDLLQKYPGLAKAMSL